MKRLSVFALLFLILISSSSLGSPDYIPAFGHFAILLHDVSPGYLPQLEAITSLIDEYGLQNETYLFVIPDHGGEMPMGKYKAFMDFLERLKREGYHVELHGYTHIGNEFNCNASLAQRKLKLGLKALSSLNVTPKYFIAPRYSLSPTALHVLLRHNLTVIGRDFIYFPNGRIGPIYNREYTWYIPSFLLSYELVSAENVYSDINGTFFLSIHPGAVNNKAGMEFMRRFLEFVVKHGLG